MDSTPNNTIDTAQFIGTLSVAGAGGAFNWLSLNESVATNSTMLDDPADYFRFTHSETSGSTLTSVRALLHVNAFPVYMREGGVAGETNHYVLAPVLGLSGDNIDIYQRFGVDAHGAALSNYLTMIANSIITLNTQLDDPATSEVFAAEIEADLEMISTLLGIMNKIYEFDGVDRLGVDVAAELEAALNIADYQTSWGAFAVSKFFYALDVLEDWDIPLYSYGPGPLFGPEVLLDTDSIWQTTGLTTAIFKLEGYSQVTLSAAAMTEIRELPIPWLEVTTNTGIIANTVSMTTGAARSEGSDGNSTDFSFVLTLTNAATVPVSVNYVVTGSGANPASANDFVGGFPSGTVTFEAGQTAVTLIIKVRADTRVESPETFTVTIMNPTPGTPNIAIGQATATGTISDDDSAIVDQPDSTATEATVSQASPARGVLEQAGDNDWFRVSLEAGATYQIDVSGAGTPALSDPRLALFDASGRQIAFDDNGGPDTAARLYFTPTTAGTYYIGVEAHDQQSLGEYSVVLQNLTTATANQTVILGALHDVIRAGSGDDKIYSRSGDDIIEGGAGADRIDGGLGSDTASYKNASAGVKVELSGAPLSSGADAEGDRLISIENLLGSAFDDFLRGDRIDNLISGGDGQDKIFGGAGADTLTGDAGDDAIIGDGGNDLIEGGAGADTLSGMANNDVIRGNSGHDWLSGLTGADQLFGGTGNDSLFGGTGADRLDGGTGDDKLNGGGADGVRDIFVFRTGYDRDRINAFDQAGNDRIELDRSLWTATQGNLSAQQVVDQFARLNANGTIATFDFGNGDILEVQSNSGIALSTLGLDILVV